MAGMSWSSSGHILCVWDSVLDVSLVITYQNLVINLIQNTSFSQYKVLLYSLDGRPLMSYSAYDNALGVKSVVWSPSSQFLSIGSYDQMV